ncbi:MAG: PepSY-associated TM helix domain-containing protein [Pseudomonadota bacterium]
MRLRSAAERLFDRLGHIRFKERSGLPKKSARRRLYDLHAWVGFHLAVIMAVVLATGTFATIADELDWLVQHDMRVMPQGEKVSWEEMVEAIEAYDPGLTVMMIMQGEASYFAYRASVIDDDGIYKFVHVNPWTGEVTGETGNFTFQYLLRNLHRYLLLPKVFGLTIVSSMAIILAISLYTGLKTSRNWRTLMTRIRFSKGARTAIGDAHKAAGLWSIWFFVLIIVTGIWYYAEFLGKDFEPTYTQLTDETAASYGDIMVDPPVSDIVQAAQAAYPELNITGIGFGVVNRQPIMVDGRVGNPIVRPRANRVYLDPMTLDVIRVQRSKELGWVQWLNQIVDPLHFGSFGGLPIKLIWFTFGLFMTGLSVSGVWLTWKRVKSTKASSMQIGALPIMLVAVVLAFLHFTAMRLPVMAGFDIIGPALFVIGLFLIGGAAIGGAAMIRRLRTSPRPMVKNALALVAVGLTAGGGIYAASFHDPFAERHELTLGVQQDGPVRANIRLTADPGGAPTGQARVSLSSEQGRLNTKSFSIRLLNDEVELGSDDGWTTKRMPMQTRVQTRYLKLSPAQLATATGIEAQFEMVTGNTYTVSWSIP